MVVSSRFLRGCLWLYSVVFLFALLVNFGLFLLKLVGFLSVLFSEGVDPILCL